MSAFQPLLLDHYGIPAKQPKVLLLCIFQGGASTCSAGTEAFLILTLQPFLLEDFSLYADNRVFDRDLPGCIIGRLLRNLQQT